jgi:hypothetical protein
MANYSLVIDSHFKPFSYAEMLAPVQAATQAHQELESAYSELETKANIWDKMASETTDPKAHSIYQKYADDLQEQAGELAKNGLSPSSRQAMLNMKKRYTQDITPIENAWNRRKELMDEQRKLREQDSTIMFDNDFRNMSLDTIMENPSIGYESLSGKDIAARTAAIASNYAKSIQNEPEFKSILKSQYWQVRQHSGWTPEQIIMDATGDSNAPEALKQIRRQMHASLKNNAAYRYELADPYISQGMHSGLGTDTYSTLADQSYVNPLEWAKFALARKQAARAARGDKEDKYKVSRLDRPIKLIVDGADKDEDKYLSKDEAEKAMEGKAVNFENLTSAQKHKVLQTIGQDDPDNYIILTSEETNWFSPNNDVVTLIPKSNVDNTGGDYGNYLNGY